MRFLFAALLILAGVAAMRPASAQTIPYVTTTCAGCTTQAQLTAAAQTFLATYLEKTPPGYVGTMEPPSAIPNGCGQGQEGATTLVVSSTTATLVGTFYGCYIPAARGTSKVSNVAIATSSDPCYVAINIASVPCATGATTNPPYKGTPNPTAPLPATTPPAWGSTSAQIKANFAANIASEFDTNPNINAAVSNMEAPMLARLSTEMKARDTGSYTQLALNYAAQRGLSAANLRLLQSAFGPSLVQTAVSAYSTAAVQAAYTALGTSAPLAYSQYSISLGGVALTFGSADMYPYDLFLVQYFSANDTAIVALHKASVYAQVRIKGFWDVLGRVGLIVGILDKIDPTWTTDVSDYMYFAAISGPGQAYGAWGPFGQIYTVPDLTISWPTVDPGQPNFPPIDYPPPDECFDDVDEDFCFG